MPELTEQMWERAVKGYCSDCNTYHPIYMVQDELWKTAWPEFVDLHKQLRLKQKELQVRGAGMNLCIGCLERRLGRLLTIDDFTWAPANANVHLGYRMALHAKNTTDPEIRTAEDNTSCRI